MPSLARAWFVIVVFSLVISLAAGCSSDGPSNTAFQGFAGCPAGATSAIAFLQRSLDAVGEAEAEDLVALLPDFDGEVRAMLLRAQEVHCTEEGFNAAITVRVDELVASGPGGMLLIEVVRERGLGSLDENRGGLIELPTG
jgi:hypothetical protein